MLLYLLGGLFALLLCDRELFLDIFKVALCLTLCRLCGLNFRPKFQFTYLTPTLTQFQLVFVVLDKSVLHSLFKPAHKFLTSVSWAMFCSRALICCCNSSFRFKKRSWTAVSIFFFSLWIRWAALAVIDCLTVAILLRASVASAVARACDFSASFTSHRSF